MITIFKRFKDNMILHFRMKIISYCECEPPPGGVAISDFRLM